MTTKDQDSAANDGGNEGASGSRWEPETSSEATAEHPTLADQTAVPPPPADEDTPTKTRWRPTRTVRIAAAAALAGLVLGGVGGWAAGSSRGHDDRRMNPTMVGFQRDGDGRFPGNGEGMPGGGMPGGGMPGGGQFGGPGGPGVMPGQPQLGQDDQSGDGTGSDDDPDDGGQQS